MDEKYVTIENKVFGDFSDNVLNTIFVNCMFVNIEDSFFRNCWFIACDFCNINNSHIKQSFFKRCDFQNKRIIFSEFDDVKIHYSKFFNARIVSTIFKNIESYQNLYFDLQCPEKGEFIGYKKIHDFNGEYLCKLLIPEDAKRSSATTKKCRCSKAKVLSITDIKTGESVYMVEHIVNAYITGITFFKYTVNEYVYPDSFNEDRFNECSNGIHFFMNKQDALDY